jgi:hypothetical protein
LSFGPLRRRGAGPATHSREHANPCIRRTEQRVDHGEALEAAAHFEFVGHTHAAVQLHGTVGDIPG